MCGLAGLVDLSGGLPLERLIRRMADTLTHRGPDDSGHLVEGNVALGFRRLAILDLEETGHQPMTSADGSFTIVFNGEIFNYIELRRELQMRGYLFRSTGDTEVLLAAYAEWGADCLARLNGMWAFLILDRRRRLLFGSRDRFGVKPLFVRREKAFVLFGSEIKAIRAARLSTDEHDWGTIADFLVRGRLDEGNRTFFEGIEQIPAGTAFELGLEGCFRQWQFWSLLDVPAYQGGKPIEEFAELFEDSVRLRMRSDVPVGVFLSGGVDSTSILCALARGRLSLPEEQRQKLRALSFVDSRFDESPYIGDTIRQTGAELEQVTYGAQDVWSDLPRVLWHHDQPVHSTTALVGFRLAEIASARGLKVILNGQGADETAAGYPSYFDVFWQTVLATRGLKSLLRELEDYSGRWGGSVPTRLLRILRYRASGFLYGSAGYSRFRVRRDLAAAQRHPWFTPDFLAALEPTEQRSNQDVDLNTALRRSVERAPLPLYLRIEDRNSSAHSIEIRTPFLDYRLVSLLFSLPAELKMKGPYNKYIIREAMKGRIPDSVLQRHEKYGFPSPAATWMSELQSHILGTVESSFARHSGIFNIDRLRSDINRHSRGEIDIGNRIFNVMQYLVWAEGADSDRKLDVNETAPSHPGCVA